MLRPADGGTAQETAAPSDARRLVAVLAAPNLRPGGAVFAVREGKNRIGSDRASEVCLGEDAQVSEEHALLLFRGGVFHLADRMSTNGTRVNGEDLAGTHSKVLQDRDRIQCGATEMVFLALKDSDGTPEGHETPRTNEPPDRA